MGSESQEISARAAGADEFVSAERAHNIIRLVVSFDEAWCGDAAGAVRVASSDQADGAVCGFHPRSREDEGPGDGVINGPEQ